MADFGGLFSLAFRLGFAWCCCLRLFGYYGVVSWFCLGSWDYRVVDLGLYIVFGLGGLFVISCFDYLLVLLGCFFLTCFCKCCFGVFFYFTGRLWFVVVCYV